MRIGLSRVKRDNSRPQIALVIYPDNEKERRQLENLARGKIKRLKIELRNRETGEAEAEAEGADE